MRKVYLHDNSTSGLVCDFCDFNLVKTSIDIADFVDRANINKPEIWLKNKCQYILNHYLTKNIDLVYLDTKIVLGTKIFGIISNRDQAQEIITKLSGRRHRIITVIGVVKQGKIRVNSIKTIVSFKKLTVQEQEYFVNSGMWQGKIAGYINQDKSLRFLKFINGSPAHIKGIPAYSLYNLLSSL